MAEDNELKRVPDEKYSSGTLFPSHIYSSFGGRDNPQEAVPGGTVSESLEYSKSLSYRDDRNLRFPEQIDVLLADTDHRTGEVGLVDNDDFPFHSVA